MRKIKTIIKLFFALFAFFAAKDILKFFCVSAVDHPPFKRWGASATALPLVTRPSPLFLIAQVFQLLAY
jgi:hypothetical protein